VLLHDFADIMGGICSNKNADGDQTKNEDKIKTSIDTEKKNVNEKVDTQNNSTVSPNDHQDSKNKSMSSDDCPLVDAKANNAKESGDPPRLDKSASNDTKG
jgi:hypothetical protein